jgi:Zn-dependent peptidase ImmA (M78 family)
LGENILGIYLKASFIANPFIVLNDSLPACGPKTRVVAVHELGHHFTTVGLAVHKHCNYSRVVRVNKIEKAAIRWGCKFLIPDQELYKSLRHGQPSTYELAQKFNVTEDFLITRLKIFQEEGYYRKHGSLFQRLQTTSYLGSFNAF